ncbi:MAG TPA: 3-hydroxyacyl-CoA dehydrogenase NAD-binding domain-containing protein [Candidatus Dormibacteraeota bacterium]|nr:3-hydroxyacyl-CoA dehydrogenase NAD-binding domain-containing protein [Candidatus Dormibacteraeota bacterium]
MAVNRISVVWAGSMGRHIACAAALGGFETTIEDVRPRVLEQAMDWLRRTLDEGVAQGRISVEEARRALALLHAAGHMEEAADADLVIEAGPEEMELKTELFGMLDKFTRARTILATSTRSLLVADMAAITQRPERCIGMRFLEPALEARRLELVRAPETSEETVEACREVGRRMGKDVVTLDELPAAGGANAPGARVERKPEL